MLSPHSDRATTQLPRRRDRRAARRTKLTCLATLALIATLLPLAPAAHAAGNQGVQLDGADGHGILLGSPGSLGAAQFTLELWFRRTGTGTVVSTGSGGVTTAIPLITKGRSENDGSNVDTNYFLGINNATGTLAADFEDTASGLNHPVLGATNVSLNTWHHGAATFNGSQFCLYLDGALDGTCTPTTAVPRSDSIQTPAIGTSTNSTGLAAGAFLGQVDEARIWNTARSLAQIQGSMNQELTSGTGLIGRWGMNEGSGTTTAGSIGGINGTLTAGATWVAGAPALGGPPPSGNTGIQFDGTNDYVTFGTALGMDAATFTVETWFNRTGAGAGTTTGTGGIASAIPLVTKGRGEAENSNVDMNYFLGIDASNGRLVADYEEGAGQTSPGLNHPITGTTAVTQNVWHHAAVTFDGTTLSIYLDGVLDGTVNVGANHGPRFDSIQHGALGSALTSTGVAAGFFAGTIDESRVWNVARSQGQIAGSMNQELTSGTGLIARWGLNEGSGTTAAGSVGGINGTLTNGPTWVAGAPALTTPPPPPGNTAIQFDGTNDYVTFGAAPGLGAATFTLETWFMRAGTGLATQTGSGGLTSAIPLIAKGRNEQDASNVDMNYFLGIDTATNRLAADFEEGASGTTPGLNHPIIGNTTITSNVWHHAAVTYDGTTWRLYLDGVADGTLSVGQPPRADSIQHAALGAALDSTGAPVGAFAGVLDEVRVWNVARTQSQIQTNQNLELTSGAGLIGRYGLNQGSGPTAVGSVGPNGTLTNGPTWVAGAPALSSPGASPDAPVIVGPLNGATGVTMPPTLDVTASDADSNDLTVTFYGREHAAPPGADFTIVAIPDTQYYSETASLWPIFTAQTNWIVNTKDTLNTVFATHLGDVAQNFNTIEVEYQRASTSMAVLDNNGIKNGVLPGNHDFANNGSSNVGSFYDQYFPPSRYQGFNWYGGYLGDPNDGIADGGFNRLNKDNYELFTASGIDFLIIHLENDMPSYATAWAQNVINAYPNRKVIISTHAFVDQNGNRGTAPVSRADGQSAQAVWNSLISPNCQIFMVVNGHYHGEGRRSDLNSCGQPVYQLNSDYQEYVNGGDGWLRYYTFKPSENKIYAYTYSPTTTGDPDGFDTTNGGQFTLDWPMSAAGAYTEIGSVSGVASGAHATIQWNGLDQSTMYDWYAVVSDGSHTTTGSTQSFTTEVPPPAAPVVDSASVDQANPHTNDTLSVTAQSHDVNQDPVTYTYRWMKNGSPIGVTTATLNLGNAGNGDRGDQIAVEVTGHDGTFDSVPVTSPAVTIQNTAPTATVGLAPATPRPTQLVTATATRADADNDVVTLTYVWKLNGSVVKTTAASPSITDTIDLSIVGAASNDTLRVEVTPNDGSSDGTMVSANVPVYAPTVSSLPLSTYQVNGKVNTMLRVGNRVYIGGDFTQLLGHNGEIVPRLNLAALDAETGLPVAWDPSADGVVYTLAASPDGSKIYAGGVFKHLGALTRTRLAAIDATSGAVLAWAPSASLTVRSIVATGSTVYVGGQFQNLSGQARAGLGAIDATTGSILPGWTPSANGIPDQMLITPDGRVIVVGAFTTINGSPSPYLASIDATNGALLPWADHPPAPSEGLTMGSGRLFVGADVNVSGNQVFAYNLTTGVQQWVGTGDGDALALTFLDGVVYVGGHFDNMAGQPRKKLAAFDPVTGTLRDWATSVNTAVAVLSMTSGGHKLYIGGGFTDVNGVAQQRYAVFTGPPAPSTPPVVDSVAIDQAAPGTGDTLSATVASHDADGDPVTYAYQWTLNGGDILNATGPTLDLSFGGNGDKGDVIRVRVTASDGASSSPAVTSAGVTVVNTAPTATVALDSDAPGTNATLTATVTRADADNDSVSLTYLWTVNGATVRTTVTTGLTDALDLSVPGNGDPSDVVVVTVTPNDGTANGSGATDSATVGTGAVPAIFSDEFGNLGSWTTVTRLTLDGGVGSPSAPSARAQVAALSAFATRDLGTSYNQVCFSTNVNLASGSTFDILRMLTGSGGKIIKVALNGTNRLLIRSEFAASVMNSQVVLGTGWHNIELCGTVGTSTTWDLYRDGVKIVNAWQANTGTTGVGRIQIGDAAATTFTANFDHVVLDLAPGDSAVADTAPPTIPGMPTGSSLSPGSITISWAASTDDTPPITYRIYRDGDPGSIGSTLNTSFTDSGLTPGTSHSYTVDAVDGVNHASAQSPPSTMIPVSVGTPSIFSDDFTTGDFSAWTSTTQFVIDNAIGSPSTPSARAQTVAAAAFAARDLGSTFNQVCLSVNVNVSSGSGFDLLRLRTAANGPIIKLAVNAGGKVQIRSEVGATSLNSGVALGTGWHNVEVCGTVGAATTWDVYRDGVKIVNAWAANTGTTPVGRIQIGDAAAATFTANFDYVVLDQVAG